MEFIWKVLTFSLCVARSTAAVVDVPLDEASASILNAKIVQPHIAAAREAQADIELQVFSPCAPSLLLSISDSNNASKVLKQQIQLCDYTTCPILPGKHIMRVPILFPRQSAPGNYSISIALLSSTMSASVALELSVQVHEVLRVQGCPACGSVLATTRSGMPIYSNGVDQGTGDSCNGVGSWGYQYQCVELVQRYYQQMFRVAYAAQMCANRPSNFYIVSSPQAGDIYVTAYGTYGHTALVHNVNSGSVEVLEQNGSCSGLSTYSIAGAECFLRSN